MNIMDGCEVSIMVSEVNRATDTFFKRVTAEGFYKLLEYWMGAEVVYNHADYRLSFTEKCWKHFLSLKK